MKHIKLLLWIALLSMAHSCGDGSNEINHFGICDGYLEWSTSDYILPYPTSSSHKVSQGNCGVISHYGSQQYAYDYVMDTNDTIVASRAGTVTDIIESHVDGNGCPDANYVQIEHNDGSVAHYAHLTKNGALVDKGDTVNQGDNIGLAGNTGCSTDSHLHFVVYKNATFEDSLPITFRNTSKNARGLLKNTEYTAN